MNRLYCDINGVSGLTSATVSQSHNSSTATANIQCINTTLDIGSPIEVYMGYVGNYDKVFKGYVKNIERKVPDTQYQITAYDDMIRAVDYFIAAPSPDAPYNYGRGIAAEDLVQQVLAMAGLTSFTCPDPTSFSLGVNSDVEVNLTSVYDYCKMIADIVTWHLYADSNGTIHFANRKPYVMGVNTVPPQPGWHTDSTVGNTMSVFLDFGYRRSERDLRNKIVVYGAPGISAEASNPLSYDPYDGNTKQVLPVDYYKTVVASTDILGSTEFAQQAADFNLELFNRLQVEVDCTIIGDPTRNARVVNRIASSFIPGLDGSWYVYTCEHNWSRAGYTTALTLRK